MINTLPPSRWRCAAPAWREGLQGARQPTQRFSGTAPVCWVAPAPTRSALRALDECAELLRPAGGCCAAVRRRRFGTRMARSASAPRSGARRFFWPHRALGEPKSPRRMTPKSSTGKTKVVENLEKMMMVQVYQRASHHNRHNRVFHIEGPPGTLMTTPLDTPVDVPGPGRARSGFCTVPFLHRAENRSKKERPFRAAPY